jgi:hypothetical protein
MTSYAYVGQPFDNNATASSGYAYLGQPFVGNLVTFSTISVEANLTTLLPNITSVVDVVISVSGGVVTIQPAISAVTEEEIQVLGSLLTSNPTISSIIDSGVREAEDKWKILVQFYPRSSVIVDGFTPNIVLDNDNTFLIRQ